MNRLDARSEIMTALSGGWNAVMPSIVGTNHELRYWAKKYSTNVEVTKYWGNASIQTVLEDQDTLRNEVRRFRSSGIVILQLFAPMNDPSAPMNLDLIAEAMRNIFRYCTAADNVQFARARIVDNISPENGWLRNNVVSEFEYNQFL